jgi:hypothetical protein
MLSSALVATCLALAPAATAALKPRPVRPPPPANTGFVTTRTTTESYAKCKAYSASYNFKSSQDAHVSAGVPSSSDALEKSSGNPVNRLE